MKRFSTEILLQTLRAVVAKELVLARGFSRAKAARVLSVTPPAVSQYVSGKRGGVLVPRIEHDRELMKKVSAVVDDILSAYAKSPERVGLVLLRFAEKLSGAFSGDAELPQAASFGEASRRRYLGLLRDRLAEEHTAAQESMRFAQSCQDEMMKTLFRQIASDSLRHADTVSVLINCLERPESFFDVRLPSKEAVDRMIQQEEAADEADLAPLKVRLGAAARLLIESIEADERKHVLLLKGLQAVIRAQAEKGYVPTNAV